MPSPFPGMDPYLEDPWRWPDLHLILMAAIRTELTHRLPEGYRPLLDRYVRLYEPSRENREWSERSAGYLIDGLARSVDSSSTISAPAKAVLNTVREEGAIYLRILDRKNRCLVTVLELLTPDSKYPRKDRDTYLLKRNEYLAAGINLVELDLLRGGERGPFATPPPTTDYLVLACRANEAPDVGVWPVSVRDPLPEITIPLRPEDGDVTLSLQPCLERAYDDGGYADEIDYSQPPNPPLPEPDATWARELLASKLPTTPDPSRNPP